MNLTFVGSTSVSFEADPWEYRGMSVPRITQEIMALLKSIAPNVDFFEQDVAEAANELASSR